MAARKVAVIGSGLAGIAAAASARQAGAEVTLVFKGHAATSFCSGGLDVANDACAPRALPAETCTDIKKNLARLLLSRPLHPYHLLTKDQEDAPAGVRSHIQDAASLLFPSDGLMKLSGGLDQNRACFSSLGALKFCALFPESTATLSAEGMDRPAALGVSGLLDFDPEIWARVAAHNASGLGRELKPGWATINFGGDYDRQSPEVAEQIRQDPKGFIQAVKQAMAGVKGARAVVLAPMLPAGRAELIRGLADALSLPVYETLSLPPSMPGLRLCQHLEGRARELGVELVRGEVHGFEADGRMIKSLTVKANREEQRIEAGAFVLAAGKFLGRGIAKQGAFSERVFGLPVFVGESAPGEIFIQKVLGLHVTDEHALFAAGVRVDEMQRPVDTSLAPAYENLFAAGAVISGYNYVLSGDGAGTALATGLSAGRRAAGKQST